MKKVFFTLAVAGIVTFASCKKEDKKVEETTTEEVATEEMATEEAPAEEGNASEEMSVPTFENQDLQAAATMINEKFSGLMEASKSGDVDTANKLTQELGTAVMDVQKAGASQEDLAKFMEWYQGLQAAAAGE